MRLTNAEDTPLRPETKLSGVVDDRVAALDRSADAFVEGIMVSDDDVVTIGDTSDAPVIIGEELVGLETAQESDNIAIAALLAVAVLWGTCLARPHLSFLASLAFVARKTSDQTTFTPTCRYNSSAAEGFWVVCRCGSKGDCGSRPHSPAGPCEPPRAEPRHPVRSSGASQGDQWRDWPGRAGS